MTRSTKLEKKTSQKSTFNILWFNNKGTTEIKDLQKLSSKGTSPFNLLLSSPLSSFNGQTL